MDNDNAYDHYKAMLRLLGINAPSDTSEQDDTDEDNGCDCGGLCHA